MSVDLTPETTTEAYEHGYRDGVQAQVDICIEHNLIRLAEALAVIERHTVGPDATEALRNDLLRIVGCGGAR